MRGKGVWEHSALKRRGGPECGWERGGEHPQVEAVVGGLQTEVVAFQERPGQYNGRLRHGAGFGEKCAFYASYAF
jgi:hypothetical protein